MPVVTLELTSVASSALGEMGLQTRWGCDGGDDEGEDEVEAEVEAKADELTQKPGLH